LYYFAYYSPKYSTVFMVALMDKNPLDSKN